MEEINLNEIFVALWTKKKIIIATTIIFALIGCLAFVIVNNFTKDEIVEESQSLYYAQTTFIVSTSQTTTTHVNTEIENANLPFDIIENSRVSLDETIIQTYNEIIKSQTTLNNIIQKLNLDINVNTLYNYIAVSRIPNTNLTRIIVAYPDKDQAVQIADELMNDFYNNMSTLYFIDQVSVIDKAYILSDTDMANVFKTYIQAYASASDTKTLEQMVTNLGLDNLISDKYLSRIFNNEIFTDKDIEKLGITNTLESIIHKEPIVIISAIKYTIIAAILGGLASVFVIAIIELFDKTIKNEEYVNTKKLAFIDNKDNTEIFSILKIKLDSNKSILLTSDENNNNLNYVSNQLATAFANSKKKTLLLNLTSNESDLVKKANEKGFGDYLNNIKDLNKYISKTNIENLDVLLSGTISNLEENKLKKAISDLEEHYDNIIINSNNILENAISLEISKLIKNTVLVETQRNSKIDKYNKAQETISEVDGHILGTILVK